MSDSTTQTVSVDSTTSTPISTTPTTTTPSPSLLNINDTIMNQNNSLTKNLKHIQNKNNAEQQKMFYQELQTNFLVIINFYLFYFYLFLSLIFGYYWFFVKQGYTIRMKWFWYLHVIFLPYLFIYTEFVLYYLWKYLVSWLNGNPFYPWNNYTSFPPIY